MKFTISNSIEILERTPQVVSHLLTGLTPDWTTNNEGGETWSAYDVIGHLLHGDKIDWMGRIEIILSENSDKKFKTVDRFAQFENSKGKTINELLDEFIIVREVNLNNLKKLNISEEDFLKTGIHPQFGNVTLAQLISTWAMHDLDHISQISRVMASQYKAEVGPWIEYLRILNPSK